MDIMYTCPPDTIALCSRSPGGLYCACNNVHRIVLHRGHYSCNTGTWHRFKNHVKVICGAPILPSMNKTARGLPATSGSLCFQFSYLSQLLGPFAHLNNIFMSLGHTQDQYVILPLFIPARMWHFCDMGKIISRRQLFKQFPYEITNSNGKCYIIASPSRLTWIIIFWIHCPICLLISWITVLKKKLYRCKQVQ